VREDAYGRLGDVFSGRISNVYNNYLHLEYLTREAARDAIEKPVEMYNAEHGDEAAITVEPELTDAVLDEVRRGNLALGARRSDREGNGSWSGSDADEIEAPFLQLVMARLWECERERHSQTLRKKNLEAPRQSCATTSAARSPDYAAPSSRRQSTSPMPSSRPLA
jgi:hypothetical protein